MSDNTASPTGIPVDRSGGPTVDPTKNVLDLVAAANRRTDDLREADSRRLQELMDRDREHTREVLAIRTMFTERIDTLRAVHADQIREAETKRIDAIRAVDVGAVAVAAERAAATAQVLATTGAQQAETLRTLVETRSVTLATQTAATLQPIIEQIASLQKAQYEGAGKSGVTDPAIAQLSADMRDVISSLASGAGAKQGAIDTKTAISWGLATIVALIVIFGFLMQSR